MSGRLPLGRPSKVIGLAGFVLVLLVCDHLQAALVNGGFETVESTSGALPTTYGDWSWDVSAIVGPENGITPYEGSRMLHLINSTATGPSSSVSSQVIQLIDMSSYSVDIAAGNVMVKASAMFNRVLGDAETDTIFDLQLKAYDGDPATFTTLYASHLAVGSDSVDSDGDPGTWELVDASLLLPANTDFVAVEVDSFENIFNDTSGAEFDGHYADAVTFTVVLIPEPCSLSLLVLVGLSLLGRRSRST